MSTQHGLQRYTLGDPLSIAQDGANNEPLIAGHTPRGRRGVTRQPQPSYGIYRRDEQAVKAEHRESGHESKCSLKINNELLIVRSGSNLHRTKRAN